MQFTIKTLAFLAAISFGSLASAQVVAFGQELQENDQTNHWVAWLDGEDKCHDQRVLEVLTKNPCDQPFQLGEVMYSFQGCIGDSGSPTMIVDSGGLTVGPCSSGAHKQFNCHPPIHDVIERGNCVVQTG